MNIGPESQGILAVTAQNLDRTASVQCLLYLYLSSEMGKDICLLCVEFPSVSVEIGAIAIQLCIELGIISELMKANSSAVVLVL